VPIIRVNNLNSIFFAAQEPCGGVGKAPIAYYDRLLTRKEWAKLVMCANEFYANVTDAEIEDYNDPGKLSPRLERPYRKDSVQPRPLPGYVYVLSGGGYYKIGLSKHVGVRIKQISPKLPFDVELVCTIKTDDMAKAEAYLHGKYASKRAKGEWFALTNEDLKWLSDTDALTYSDGYDKMRSGGE